TRSGLAIAAGLDEQPVQRVGAPPGGGRGGLLGRGPVVPDTPGRGAAVPQGAEVLDVAHRVGALPEAFVLVDGELAVGGQALERPALQDAVVLRPQPVQDGTVED